MVKGVVGDPRLPINIECHDLEAVLAGAQV